MNNLTHYRAPGIQEAGSLEKRLWGTNFRCTWLTRPDQGADPAIVSFCSLEKWPEEPRSFKTGHLKNFLPENLLGRRERSMWLKMKGPVERLGHWLAGRVAAKTGLMEFLNNRSGLRLEPCDIEIIPDRAGRPIVCGNIRRRMEKPPLISISHAHKTAVALIDPSEGRICPGIDIESSSRYLSPPLLEKAFSGRERRLIAGAGPDLAPEWALRFWCAKEAAAKALGLGLVGRTKHFRISRPDFVSGGVQVTWADESAAAPYKISGRSIPVITFKSDGYILGMT